MSSPPSSPEPEKESEICKRIREIMSRSYDEGLEEDIKKFLTEDASTVRERMDALIDTAHGSEFFYEEVDDVLVYVLIILRSALEGEDTPVNVELRRQEYYDALITTAAAIGCPITLHSILLWRKESLEVCPSKRGRTTVPDGFGLAVMAGWAPDGFGLAVMAEVHDTAMKIFNTYDNNGYKRPRLQ